MLYTSYKYYLLNLFSTFLAPPAAMLVGLYRLQLMNYATNRMFSCKLQSNILVGAIFASINLVEDGGMNEFKQDSPFHASPILLNSMLSCKVLKIVT